MPRKRELIDTGTDKRYVRRDKAGQFRESDDFGRSLSSDVRRKAKSVSEPGQGDNGDRRPASKKAASKEAPAKRYISPVRAPGFLVTPFLAILAIEKSG
jgi:hypothetical protein